MNNHTLSAISTALLLLCAPAHALAQPAPTPTESPAHPSPSPITRPAYQQLRFAEDWSVLRDAPREGMDQLKFIPLNEAEDVYLSIGGQLRLRLENFNNFGFNDANDDTYALVRARFHTDLHVGECFRAFVELKSAYVADRDLPGSRRTLDMDTFDVQNAFVDVRIPIDEATLTLRPGRQELLFGRQRLVSPLDWANARRTFDGVGAILDFAGWKLHSFWTRPVEVRKYDFNKTDNDTDFYGLYTTTKLNALMLDLYWLGLDSEDVTIALDTGTDHRHTFGARISGPIADSGFDFDIETAVQIGRHAGRDILAFMLASELGYRFAGAPWTPRLFAGFDYASGDNNPTDDNARTFNQLFPLGHAYFGAIDAIGRQNIIGARAGASIQPTSKLTLTLEGHLFWLADTDDALYNVGGGVLRAPVADASSEVGQEIDFTLQYNFARGWTAQIGYSRLFAGAFISDTGPDEDIDFFFTTFQFTF